MCVLTCATLLMSNVCVYVVATFDAPPQDVLLGAEADEGVDKLDDEDQREHAC